MSPAKFTCILVDDEPPATRILRRYLHDFPQIEVIEVCHHAQEALQKVQDLQPDLLLLDVQMPGLDGLSLLKALGHPPLCILITAFPEYALQGFELEVLDYLLKPVAPERFAKALDRALLRLQARTEKPAEGVLALRVDRKNLRLPYSQVHYLQALGNYVKIVSAQGTFVPRLSFNEVEMLLPTDQFIRIHRSYLVNSQSIQHFTTEHVVVNKAELPLARSYRKAVLRKLV
jgi:DNA-binding LytR/AlgR family response regulator